MVAHRTPRTLKAATSMLERFAGVDGQIASIEEARRAELAKVNAAYDELAAPLLTEHVDLKAKLTSWWQNAGASLTQGKRKSMAIGGCEIGSRSSAATLGIEGDEKKITAALASKPWAQELVRTTTSIDRAAVLKSIDGAHAKDLARLGFSKIDGTDTPFVKRVQQGGTQGAAAAS